MWCFTRVYINTKCTLFPEFGSRLSKIFLKNRYNRYVPGRRFYSVTIGTLSLAVEVPPPNLWPVVDTAHAHKWRHEDVPPALCTWDFPRVVARNAPLADCINLVNFIYAHFNSTHTHTRSIKLFLGIFWKQMNSIHNSTNRKCL